MEDQNKQRTAYPLRMPEGLREMLEEEARRHGRSLNAEIVGRLAKTLNVDLSDFGVSDAPRGTSLLEQMLVELKEINQKLSK